MVIICAASPTSITIPFRLSHGTSGKSAIRGPIAVVLSSGTFIDHGKHGLHEAGNMWVIAARSSKMHQTVSSYDIFPRYMCVFPGVYSENGF